MNKQWARIILGLVLLASAGSLFAQAINQPPELCYNPNGLSDCSTYGQGGFGTYIEDTILIPLIKGQGTASIGVNVADPDGGSGVENATITSICNGSSSCSLTFTGDVNNIESCPSPGVCAFNGPVSTLNQILTTMALSVYNANQNLETLATVTVVLNDNGYTGACSSTDSAPCDKYAKWVLYFDAFPGTVPDRIFLNGFEQQ